MVIEPGPFTRFCRWISPATMSSASSHEIGT